MNDLGATRIAHGVRAVEDPGLLADLAERNVTLDLCLTSNKALGVFPDTARHPLPALLAAGVGCSLGADDPLMFGAGLLDEYQTARSVLGLVRRSAGRAGPHLDPDQRRPRLDRRRGHGRRRRLAQN